MPKCNNCDSWVSQRFYRVFSNEQGELWGCPDCGSKDAGERRAFKDKQNRSVKRT